MVANLSYSESSVSVIYICLCISHIILTHMNASAKTTEVNLFKRAVPRGQPLSKSPQQSWIENIFFWFPSVVPKWISAGEPSANTTTERNVQQLIYTRERHDAKMLTSVNIPSIWWSTQLCPVKQSLINGYISPDSRQQYSKYCFVDIPLELFVSGSFRPRRCRCFCQADSSFWTDVGVLYSSY